MQKRPLVVAAGFFLAGILTTLFNINKAAVIFAVIALVVWFSVYKRKHIPLLLFFLAFLLLGGLRTHQAQEKQYSIQREYAGNSKYLTMTVTEFSDNGKVMADFVSNGETVKVYLSSEESVDLAPGDIICADVYLQKPFDSKLSLSGFSTYLLSCRTYLCGYADSVEISGRHKSGIKGIVYSIRRYASSVGKDFSKRDVRGLFNAMVIGDKHLLSDELSDKLQCAGLNHIAVVSGMHLSLIVAVLSVLLERLAGRRKRSFVICVAGILLMTLVTGAGASVVRACIMCVTVVLARIFRRESDTYTSLMLSVLIMSAFNPFIIFNAGFVLSVASVLGILLFNRKIYRLLPKRMNRFVKEAASVTLSAQMIVTLPVIYYFGIFTPYSVFSNILVTVLANAVVIMGMLFVLLHMITPIAFVLKFAVSVSIAGITKVCDLVSMLPGSLMEIPFSFAVVVICVCVAVIVYKCFGNRQVTLRIAAVGLTLIIAAACVETYRSAGIKMQFVNYGAENMSVLFFPDGESMLVDCPGPYDAQEILAQQRTDFYDYVVLTDTKPESVSKLAESGSVKTVILPKDIFLKDKDSVSMFEKQGINVIFLGENEAFSGKTSQVRYLFFDSTGKDVAAVEIRYKDKKFVSLQAFDHNEIEKIYTSGMQIDCDWVKLPGADFHDPKALADMTIGKILGKEKEFTAKIY